MTVNELIDELTALREHHRCGDLDVVGVRRVWHGFGCDDVTKAHNYDFEPTPLVRPRLCRPDGYASRVVELAPESANG